MRFLTAILFLSLLSTGICCAVEILSAQQDPQAKNYAHDFKTRTTEERESIVLTLYQTGDTGAVPVLIEALKDVWSDIRCTAANALGNIGPAAKDAVPALIQELKDMNENVKSCAAKALIKIGKPAVPASAEALRVKNAWSVLRCATAQILGEIGDTSAVPALIEASKEENVEEGDVRCAAVTALGNIGDKSSLKVLIYVMKNDESEEVRTAAKKAINEINSKIGIKKTKK